MFLIRLCGSTKQDKEKFSPLVVCIKKFYLRVGEKVNVIIMKWCIDHTFYELSLPTTRKSRVAKVRRLKDVDKVLTLAQIKSALGIKLRNIFFRPYTFREYLRDGQDVRKQQFHHNNDLELANTKGLKVLMRAKRQFRDSSKCTCPPLTL